MKQAFSRRARNRAHSLSTVPPPLASEDYSPALAKAATSILYRSPIPSKSGHTIYILNVAALPDTHEVDYDSLLPYVLSRLPGEEDLIKGVKYEIVLFAGAGPESATGGKKNQPGWGWFVQAYHVLSRAMRKRIQRLYIVHEKTWVRVLAEMFSTVVSHKFRRKVVHASDLSALALHIPIEDLLIPPSAYLQDRTLSPDIHAPYTGGRRAFSARHPLPRSYDGKRGRLPRVLRETSSFVLLGKNVETEGVFRIPAQAKLKEILREAYDRGQKFIVWKDIDVTLPLPHYPKTENLEEILDEIDQTEAYNVHMAASLIKSWYSELRDPMVPESSYRELTKIFGSSTVEPSLKQLTELISPRSEWSPLPPMSRELLIRHLLPLLAAVGAHQEANKMTSENLAVCLAPTFVCGPDQLVDVKISALVRRILTKAIDIWPDLREACGVDTEAFENDLKAPERIEDYEDPMENESTSRAQAGPLDTTTQSSGIVLKDNDAFAEISDQTTGVVEPQDLAPPPLPPRSATASLQGILPVGNLMLQTRPPRVPRHAPTSDPGSMAGASDGANLRSGTAPPLSVPPRYSTIVGISHETAGSNQPSVVPPRYSTVVGTSDDVTESPSTYTAPANGFGPPRRGDWSFDGSDTESQDRAVLGPPHNLSSSSVKRKPVSGTSNEVDSKDKL